MTQAELGNAMERLRDVDRFEWTLPILTGLDDEVTNRRTLAIATAMMMGLDGRAAIDAAIKYEKDGLCSPAGDSP